MDLVLSTLSAVMSLFKFKYDTMSWIGEQHTKKSVCYNYYQEDTVMQVNGYFHTWDCSVLQSMFSFIEGWGAKVLG